YSANGTRASRTASAITSRMAGTPASVVADTTMASDPSALTTPGEVGSSPNRLTTTIVATVCAIKNATAAASPQAPVAQNPQRCAVGGATAEPGGSRSGSARVSSDMVIPWWWQTALQIGRRRLTKRSHAHRPARFQHDHLGRVPLHGGDELVRGRLDDRERAVVARDHGIELEEAPDCQRRRRRAHGEAVADRHE